MVAQIIHYEAGERYNKHWDAYDHHTDKGTQVLLSSKGLDL